MEFCSSTKSSCQGYHYRKSTNLYCVVGLYDDDIIDRSAKPAGRNSAAFMQWDDEAVGTPRASRLHVPETQQGRVVSLKIRIVISISVSPWRRVLIDLFGMVNLRCRYGPRPTLLLEKTAQHSGLACALSRGLFAVCVSFRNRLSSWLNVSVAYLVAVMANSLHSSSLWYFRFGIFHGVQVKVVDVSETTVGPIFTGQRVDSWPVKMGPTVVSETSSTN
jgi:hypothetical protein